MSDRTETTIGLFKHLLGMDNEPQLCLLLGPFFTQSVDLVLALYYFSHCCDQMPEKQFYGRKLISAHSSRVQAIMVGRCGDRRGRHGNYRQEAEIDVRKTDAQLAFSF